MTGSEEVSITRNTRVQLGLMITIMASTLVVFGSFMSLRHEVQLLRQRLEGLSVDRWRSHEMRAWAAELQRINPSLFVPNPNPDAGLQPFARPQYSQPTAWGPFADQQAETPP